MAVPVATVKLIDPLKFRYQPIHPHSVFPYADFTVVILMEYVDNVGDGPKPQSLCRHVAHFLRLLRDVLVHSVAYYIVPSAVVFSHTFEV